MVLENQQNPPFEALDGSNRDHGAVGGSMDPEWAVDDLGVTEEGEEEARDLLVAGGGRAASWGSRGLVGVARRRRWPGGAVEATAEDEEARRGSGGSTRRRGRTRRSAEKPKKMIAYAREAGPRRT